jgi:hypothetical protein
MAETGADGAFCTLAPPELQARVAETRALAARALVGGGVAGSDLLLRLRDTPDVAAALDALIAKERACCSFMTLTPERVDGEIHLTVRAPASFLARFAALFAEPAR